MPGICKSFCATMDSAASSSCAVVAVAEVTARFMKSESAGLVLRQVGLLGRFAGNCPRWLDSCLHIPSRGVHVAIQSFHHDVLPSWLVEVICVMPAMRPNIRSTSTCFSPSASMPMAM